ncbi:uncharacterized protein LOC135697106 [Ochlerotatus camptorhynchus]|uniref:uncharacterized protein LOC135697106 n=1 Tax=Ochlerotatus camptorhynchus TaxID=644619 RepID=UPI0031CFEC99
MFVLITAIAVIGFSSSVAFSGSTNSTATLIAEIIDAYYILRQVPLLIVSGEKLIEEDLVSGVTRSLRYPRVIQLDPIINGYQSWSYAIFFCTDYADFLQFVDKLNSDRYDLFGYYTFVFTEVSKAEILNAFKTLWKLKILRAVLIAVNEGQPQVYNYSPYTNYTCGKPTVYRIQNHVSYELFLQKLKDFYGCPLSLGTFETPPFVQFERQRLYHDIKLTGFEGDLVTTLSGKLNFRILIVNPPDNAQWGVPQRNGSTGLMKLLQDETVHFGIGCLGLMAQRNEILQPSRAHYTSQALFAVPEGLPLNPFEKLFRPYERIVWILVCCIKGGIATLVLALKFAPNNIRHFIYGEDNQTPFLNAISVFFNGGVHVVPVKTMARTLLIIWILHCFVMRTVYQGLLFRYLQDESNHRPVDTIDGIEQSDLHYYINKNSERFFQHNPGLLERVRYIAPGNDSMGAALDAISSHRVRDGVVLVTLEHIAYHNKHRLAQGFLRSTRDSFCSYPMVIYYPKRTFLVRVLNRAIGEIETAGLMSYWVRRYGNYNFFPKKINIARPTPLNIQQLMGCFASICVLWITSCGLFALELLSLKTVTLRKFLEFVAHN